MVRQRALVAILLLWPTLGVADERQKSATVKALLEAPRAAPAPDRDLEQLEQAIGRGARFLVTDQNADGSWGSAENTKNLNIYAPVPGAHHAFRAGVTSLCVAALIETGTSEREVQQAIARGERWILANLPELRRANATALYNVWGHAYGIQALVRMHGRAGGDRQRREQIKAVIRQQIELLERYESVDGGWGYYDFDVGAKKPASLSCSFTTATVLVAMDEARKLGIETPDKIVERGIESIQRQQLPNFSYLYSQYMRYQPGSPINRPGGSLGRSQACNVALRLWGAEEITDEVITAWLDRLFARNLWLDIGRKRPIPHESWFQVAGYFFYYGHYYGALCIDQLPPSTRDGYQDHLAQVLLPKQEKDGSWWDYPLYNYHRPYGTAFALLSLARCRARKEPRIGPEEIPRQEISRQGAEAQRTIEQ